MVKKTKNSVSNFEPEYSKVQKENSTLKQKIKDCISEKKELKAKFATKELKYEKKIFNLEKIISKLESKGSIEDLISD